MSQVGGRTEDTSEQRLGQSAAKRDLYQTSQVLFSAHSGSASQDVPPSHGSSDEVGVSILSLEMGERA